MQLPALTWKPLTCLQSLPGPTAFLRHLEERNIRQAGQEAVAYWHTPIDTHLFPTCGILTTSVVRWWRIWIILKTNWWLNPIQLMHILLHCNYSSHIHSHFGCLPASLKLLSFWWGKDKSWCLDTKIQAVKVTFSSQHWPSCQKGVHLLHQSSTSSACSINFVFAAWRIVIRLKCRGDDLKLPVTDGSYFCLEELRSSLNK